MVQHTHLSLMFPGQGSQAIGMGQNIASKYPEARCVFEEVDDALEQKLSDLMWYGSEEMLRLTENAQPALMAVSMAVMRVLETRGFSVTEDVLYVAGHSLGEYTALVAVKALSLADVARLLRIRGRAMQNAVPVGEGKMVAILGLDIETIIDILEQVAQEGGVCNIANDNATGQVVISGSKMAVEYAVDLVKARGAKKTIALPVSAPFHCTLMESVKDIMANALNKVKMQRPAVPIIMNVTARPCVDIHMIRQYLVDQITATVRWRETVIWLSENNVNHLIEIGSGKVLSGLVRRICQSLSTIVLNESHHIEDFLVQMDERKKKECLI